MHNRKKEKSSENTPLIIQPSAPPPWEIGPEPVYSTGYENLYANESHSVAAPEHSMMSEHRWKADRKAKLLEWGQKREEFMHRKPTFLVDQLVSGSGLYPLRMLDETQWLTNFESQQANQIADILFDVGGLAYPMALDIISLLVYDVDVRIVLDNSGSMGQTMLGQQMSIPDEYAGVRSPMSPYTERWKMAEDSLKKWFMIFDILQISPPIYFLNATRHYGRRVQGVPVAEIFSRTNPGGTTPMTQTFSMLLDDYVRENSRDSPLLVLALTDGEANNQDQFNSLLDRVQNKIYGNVQVCFMGISLEERDIEWFEHEECANSRIRTIEPFEVERTEMLQKTVITKEGEYSFAMHTYRALLTNFFPADYDYEAKIQNLRHRIYITWHGKDRWWSQKNFCYRAFSCIMDLFICTPFYLSTCYCCCGWLQGGECGHYHHTYCVEMVCGEGEYL